MKGFTLVEMLVALAALAILTSAAILITSFAIDTRTQFEVRGAKAMDLLRLRSSLKADISQATAHRARDEQGRKPQAAMQGQSLGRDGVFLSLVRRGWENPTAESRSSLQYLEYRLLDHRIERVWRRHADGSPLQPAQVLVGGVDSVEIAWLERDQWLQGRTGSSERPLPSAVRLDIELREGGAVTQLFMLASGTP
ncbi:MAG: type II secretion system minor pseudopilin GspJ [Alphaproteobacteria bacterium]|nr:type II secretion system minor pseudopilin GspJ [Alphaproteobacteria bacterium]